MVFNSVQYLLFLPAVLVVYWLLNRRHQNLLLLVASYIFYGAWDYRFLGLMWLSTLTDYTIGRLLGSTTDERRRKRIFLVSLAVNLGILGFFKYFNFFVDSAADLLRTFGFTPHLPTLNILLPVGISFYTFHGISYTFDVYRRHIEPANDLLDFAVFIAFFPQLVAGPIGRAQIQLPQFANPRQRPDRNDIRSALALILLGLFKKVAIADGLAPYVNQIFASPGRSGVGTLLIGFYGFALQVYADFSGYSDMARGSSRLFGIELLRNFEQPFLSRNTTALWRTWHISLSTWMRDYVFIPLGGNRARKIRSYVNTVVIMLIVGLWHGPAWTFVAWGGINGVYLVAERIIGDRAKARAPKEASTPIGGPMGTLPVDSRHETAVEAQAVKTAHRTEAPLPPAFGWTDLLPALLTFHLFAIGGVFFRSASFSDAQHFLSGILTLRSGPIEMNAAMVLLLAGIASFGIDIAQRNSRTETPMLAWPAPVRSLLYASLVIAIIVFSGSTPVPFIYFQF